MDDWRVKQHQYVWEDVCWYIDNLGLNLDQAIQMTKISKMQQIINDGLDVNQLDFS